MKSNKKATKATQIVEPPPETYTLEMSREQLYVVNSALELFFRCGMGQFNTILEQPDHHSQQSEQVSELLDQLHVLLTQLPTNAYHGISSSKISDSYRTANDIYQVIRHRLSWDRDPKGGMTTNFDEPMRWGRLPLIKIRKKTD